MGREPVGNTPGASIQGGEGRTGRGRAGGNRGSFGANRANLEAGAPHRFERKHALPSVGDRFGELTVRGISRERRGACYFDLVVVQCSCGAPEHKVFDYNLRKGASTRCRECAKKQVGHWRKTFWKYAEIVPDDDHRRRLLGRISACNNRCHNPNDSGFRNYGGRGIQVHAPWREDRAAFLAYVASLPGWDVPELQLDRIDNDKGYEPGNLRFISHKNNCNNKQSLVALRDKVAALEAHIRHLECGAEAQVHGAD